MHGKEQTAGEENAWKTDAVPSFLSTAITACPAARTLFFAAERRLLEAHGHRVIVYERNNETPGLAAKLLLPFRAVFSLKTCRDLRALLRRERVDIVHVHNTLFAVSPAVFWAARRVGVPAVQTLHNFRLFCPSGVLMRGGQVCEDCPLRRGGLLNAVRHACYRGSRAQSAVCAFVYAFHRLLGTYRHVSLIALTGFDRDKLLAFNARRPVFDPQHLFLKPNPVAAGKALPPLRPLSARKNQIVFAGRLEELKGLRTAIEAWKLLKGDPAAPVLLLVGDGPLESWARENAGPNVRLLGRLPRAELYALLGESRAALAPSLCYESFALVPAEAHAMGTPVLASDLGNVGAMVRPRRGRPALCPRRRGRAGRRCTRAAAAGTKRRPGRHARRSAGTIRRRTKLPPADRDLRPRHGRTRLTRPFQEFFMNQLYRALHMPPARLAKKLAGWKEVYTIAVRPVPAEPGHEPLPALGRGLIPRCPAHPGTGMPTRCSTAAAGSAGCSARILTLPPTRAASRRFRLGPAAAPARRRRCWRQTATSRSRPCSTGTAKPG